MKSLLKKKLEKILTELKQLSAASKLSLVAFVIIILLVIFWVSQHNTFYLSNKGLPIKGLENILSSSIDFLSIVIGFYSAFLGIAVSVNGNNFYERLNHKEIKYFLFCAIIMSFFTLILSFILQVCVFYKKFFWMFWIWIGSFSLSIVLLILTIILALGIVFGGDDEDRGTDGN